MIDRQRKGPGRKPRKPHAPLDSARLEELAIAYVARFATSAGRLRAYCTRKLRERGHEGASDGATPPDVDALVRRFLERGYVDDSSFARAKASGLIRRGYGARRVSDALRADGIEETLRERVAPDEGDRREAAAVYGRRRRFGPFAREPLAARDQREREKQLAALLRAGHDAGHARQVLDAVSIAEIEDWIAEAREQEDPPA